MCHDLDQTSPSSSPSAFGGFDLWLDLTLSLLKRQVRHVMTQGRWVGQTQLSHGRDHETNVAHQATPNLHMKITEPIQYLK